MTLLGFALSETDKSSLSGDIVGLVFSKHSSDYTVLYTVFWYGMAGRLCMLSR